VYAWSLVVVASTVSVALNVAHAPAHLAARLVAALPSTALLASVELLMSEARRVRGAQPSAPEQDGQPRSAEPSPDGAQHPAQAALEATERLEATGSRAIVRALLAERRELPAEEVMERTGVGRGRAYELLRKERAARNGGHGR
jgi:hypothetical protein